MCARLVSTKFHFWCSSDFALEGEKRDANGFIRLPIFYIIPPGGIYKDQFSYPWTLVFIGCEFSSWVSIFIFTLSCVSVFIQQRNQEKGMLCGPYGLLHAATATTKIKIG